MIASATLTPDMLLNAIHLLNMHPDKMITIRRSSDRPNIKIGVRKIKYALNSFADLAFMIPKGWKEGDPPPPKFLIFFDDIQDAINAAHYLRQQLPPALQNKIKWFNSDMTTSYKEDELSNLISGETWGLCTTDSFGMVRHCVRIAKCSQNSLFGLQGMDIADIILVIQWRATCKLATLWQRFGRAVRNKALSGTALLFAEKDHFDDERAAKAACKANRKATGKRATRDAGLTLLHPAKRRALVSPGRASQSERPTSIVPVAASHVDRNAHKESSSDDDESDSHIEEAGVEGPA